MIEHLWPTPVGIFDLDDPAELNAGILDLVYSGRSTKTRFDNIWDVDHPVLHRLRDTMFEHARKVCPSVGAVHRGWVKVYGEHQYITPHSHPSALAAATYYVKAEEGAGALLLQDPAAGSLWSNYTDGEEDGRVYHRIPVKTGRLIIFPGHIVHSSEPNRSKADRVILATNFRRRPTG